MKALVVHGWYGDISIWVPTDVELKRQSHWLYIKEYLRETGDTYVTVELGPLGCLISAHHLVVDKVLGLGSGILTYIILVLLPVNKWLEMKKVWGTLVC